jgi:hypothetical protein
MSRYSFDDERGERWWVGYDAAAATFFLDGDRDLDDDNYDPAPMRTVRDVEARAHERVTIPTDVLARLADDEPRSSFVAEAASVARMDQAQAALSDALRAASYPQAASSAMNPSLTQGSEGRSSAPHLPNRSSGHGIGE